MKNKSALWLILGIALLFVGILVMDKSAVVGIVMFLAGLIVMILLSISIMKRSGVAKANYFYRGGSASQKVDLGNATTEVPADIWDQMTEDKGEAE